MLSLADNGLKVLDGAALPASLEWLIAKQNQVATPTLTLTLTHTLTLTR